MSPSVYAVLRENLSPTTIETAVRAPVFRGVWGVGNESKAARESQGLRHRLGKENTRLLAQVPEPMYNRRRCLRGMHVAKSWSSRELPSGVGHKNQRAKYAYASLPGTAKVYKSPLAVTFRNSGTTNSTFSWLLHSLSLWP